MDFYIEASVPCDSSENSCFVGDGENTPESYMVIHKKAYDIPTCNAWAGDCTELSCQSGDTGCLITYCDTSIGDSCVGPTGTSSI